MMRSSLGWEKRNKREETPGHMERIEKGLSPEGDASLAEERDTWQPVWQAWQLMWSGPPEIRIISGRGAGDALVQPMRC
nr:uncharacterized protein CTRU02_05064 [Colletotrichum truncatum]KAF6794863.1 hypothetical protein CTRU02_05064 [Colletotrichum truncatum]